MKNILAILSLLVILLTLTISCQEDDIASTKVLDNELEGVWENEDKADLPESMTQGIPLSVTWEITLDFRGEKFTLDIDINGGIVTVNKTVKGTFSSDAGKSPKEIDFKVDSVEGEASALVENFLPQKGDELKGIYKIKDNKTLIIALSSKERPTELSEESNLVEGMMKGNLSFSLDKK